MNRFVRIAATAALVLRAVPAAAQESFTPPPGYVLVPAPPPGYTLAPVPVERTWVLGASTGTVFPISYDGHGSSRDLDSDARLGVYADFFLSPRFSMGLFVDRTSLGSPSSQGIEVTALGASFTRHFFGGARSTRLRGGLGLSSELRSSGGDPARSSGLGVRAFLGLVVPVGQRAAVFLQGMAEGGGDALGSLNVGLELGN